MSYPQFLGQKMKLCTAFIKLCLEAVVLPVNFAQVRAMAAVPARAASADL
jgi:hypothetical protein